MKKSKTDSTRREATSVPPAHESGVDDAYSTIAAAALVVWFLGAADLSSALSYKPSDGLVS